PRTRAQLRDLLSKRWPGRDAASMAMAVTYLVPMVQVPPRGVWGAGGQATWTSVEAWLGRPVRSRGRPGDLVIRYLAAFGPARVADIQTWSGLNRLREVIDRLRPKLRTFRDEGGRELFDLPDAPRPDPDTPVPPRFLPEYDNVCLSHHDRSHIVGDAAGKWVFGERANRSPFLVDGFVGGAWRIVRDHGTAALVIEPFRRPSKETRAALTEEGASLIAFAATEARDRDIRFAPIR
ncbi:MAG: winged helix DNA-binding domain-containing protein, partial [Actinomycetota bacterium]